MIKHTAERGRGLLTIIPLAELLCYLGVVRPTHDADLHFPPQSLEKLIQLWVDFLQITGKYTACQKASLHGKNRVQWRQLQNWPLCNCNVE